MSVTKIQDPVQLCKNRLNEVFGRTLKAWSQLAEQSESHGLPIQSTQLSSILNSIPPFPALEGLKLERVKDNLSISGRSTWHTSTDKCELPDRLISGNRMFVGRPAPVKCKFADSLLHWPGIRNSPTDKKVQGNYLAVATLAWGYILSAKWVEMAGGLGNITMHPQLPHDEFAAAEISIDIGDVEYDARRWWRAILSRNQGWSATLEYDGTTFHSPWSYALQSHWRFRIQHHCPNNSSQTSPPTSESAMKFLADFCRHHNIQGQCVAGLSAALMMPADPQATLPLPKPYLTSRQCDIGNEDVVFQELSRIPLYMTLSCYGVHSVLWAALYQPNILCNEVSPYIEAIFQVVKTISTDNDQIRLASTFAQRQPEAAALWLGAIITGFHTTLIKRFLNEGVRYIDIHALPWTRTLNSFIFDTRPILLAEEDKISREDECRLLFILNQHGTYASPPISPWKPFGNTRFDEVDMEVRLHAACGHYLQYAGWKWEGEKEETINTHHTTPYPAPHGIVDEGEGDEYEYDGDEEMSEHCTRGVMSWLRPDGIAASEKALYRHEWLDWEWSDGGTGDGNKTPSVGSSPSTASRAKRDMIEEWILDEGKVEEYDGDEEMLSEPCIRDVTL